MIFRSISTTLYGYSCFFGFLFFVERYSKSLAVAMLHNPLQLHKNVTLQLVYNRGISWSMFNNVSASVYHVITGMIFFICCALIAHTVERFISRQAIVAELFVLIGAFSNLFDRLQHQAVIDFIAFSYHGWHWPVFNVADCFIVCGLLGMLVQNYKKLVNAK